MRIEFPASERVAELNEQATQLTHVFRGARVLVTGHTGFKGSWLTAWLMQLHAEVAGLALDPDDGQLMYDQLALGKSISADHRVNVCDGPAVYRVIEQFAPDFIFHLAAQPLVRLSYEDPIGTFATNVLGTVNVLDAVRRGGRPCIVVAVTTDKCYENRGGAYGYREDDRLGGHDPYSASKACAELAAASYRSSFFPADGPVKMATARAGNVIGGGDWSRDRIVPDCMRALGRGETIQVRNRLATRPWQHVLEPLSGYLWLAATLAQPRLVGLPNVASLCDAFNFGPTLLSNRSVAELVAEVLTHRQGEWVDRSDPNAPHEAAKLHLAIDRAHHMLGWRPTWDFAQTIERTVAWYEAEAADANLQTTTRDQIEEYQAAAQAAGNLWASTP